MVDFEDAVQEFDDWCGEKYQIFSEYFHQHWLTPEWESGWVDMDRPGARCGLWNTNNASESFFKTLLRSFLGGIGNRKPKDLLAIVENNVFPYYEKKAIENQKRKVYQKAMPSLKNIEISVCANFVKFCHKTFTAIVNEENQTCDCAVYFCKGKCNHLDIYHKWKRTSLPDCISEVVIRNVKPKKVGPKKKRHLPAVLLEEKIQNARKVADKQPGPHMIVPSQRTRTRNVQLPVRYRK